MENDLKLPYSTRFSDFSHRMAKPTNLCYSYNVSWKHLASHTAVSHNESSHTYSLYTNWNQFLFRDAAHVQYFKNQKTFFALTSANQSVYNQLIVDLKLNENISIYLNT